MNAFITGAASGIGRATAEALINRGWSVALADLFTDDLEAVRSQAPDRVHIYKLDVTDADAFEQAVSDFANKHHGQLRLLFNCAGILEVNRFTDISRERHQQILDINIKGVINGCQAAYPYLKAAPEGQVINMSSASATYGIPEFAVYSASKFAVQGLTEALNLEWRKDGIHVGDVMPPFVKTPMLTSQKHGAHIIDALGVNLTAEDVAEAVLKQLSRKLTHRTVSLQFTLLYLLGQISPRPVTGWLIRLLSRS
ncbi:MAG: SDR family oxidoreductase [Pseudomonadota bacterium]|nr:SDR family oxidoreductase [Pseudomonadota bacterium]